MLKVDNINVYYGNIHAVTDISFEVRQGEIVTLIGANGAGKSTILNTISGQLRSKTGSLAANRSAGRSSQLIYGYCSSSSLLNALTTLLLQLWRAWKFRKSNEANPRISALLFAETSAAVPRESG